MFETEPIPNESRVLYEPAYDKRDLIIFRTVVLKMCMRSPLFGYIHMFVLVFSPETSSRFLLHVCEQQRLWLDCANAQARLRLYWSPM